MRRRVLYSWLLLVATSLLAATSSAQSPPDVPVAGEVAAVEVLALPATGEGLTLGELQAQAAANSPTLQKLSAQVRAAGGKAYQAGLMPNPSVGYEGQQLGSGGLAEQHGVVFTQEIVRGGKLALARAVASRERMKLEQQLATAELRLQTRVQIAFCEALLAQREIELTTQLVRFSREGISSVETLQRAGEVGQADVLQAQVELEAASMLQAAAEQRLLAAWRELGALLGSTELPVQPLSGDIAAVAEPLDFGATLIEVQARSPEVAAAVVEIQRARYALARARVEPTPNINFQGLYNWQDNGIGGGDDGAVQVLLPVPLFNRNQGAIAAAQCELVAARQALREIQQQLQQRLAGTLQEYETARMQAERYRTSLLPSAAKSLDLTRELYGAGETNYTALLTAQRTYSQLSRSYLEAVGKLRIAEAQLEGLLVDSIDATR